MLVYRTEKYQKLKLEIEKQSKKLEKKKEAHGETSVLDRSKKKKLEQVMFHIVTSVTDPDPHGSAVKKSSWIRIQEVKKA